MSVSPIGKHKRPEELDPNLLSAQCLKITILRLLNAYVTPSFGMPTHPDDWQYDVYGLVLVLGRQRTAESRWALLDLLDFNIPDAVHDAIVTVVYEEPSVYRALLEARIGQPLCAEALREKPYVAATSREGRDQGITNWLAEDPQLGGVEP